MASGATQPFRPAGTVAASASTSAVNVALAGGGQAVLVYNASAATAFFRLGGASGLSASGSDTPVPAGARMLVDAGPFVTNAAVLLSSGTGTVYFTLGDGDTY
ncbi:MULTISPECIES: hypothetical protein [Acidocella]|uniref:hypothetical protein n=1 Tax=Acidocella TaxID=50709 RepID=UPI00028DC387|nr:MULTISPECIES: hypothetical protein [Acidocella]EKM99031.1 hypothetical protein MXAZACID_12467 [Acidocella sp. MX-AZ02]WBO58546.1 hypothetical protein GT370_15410 [Acidocella sp. MX-AZ03]